MPLPQKSGLSNVQKQQSQFEQEQKSVLYQERQFAGLPEAFQTNFIDDERLESLSDTFSRGQVVDELDSTVLSISTPQDRRFTEKDAIDLVLDRFAAAYALPERTVQMPGVELNRKLIYAAAKAFKDDTDTPSGTIKPPELATADDIVFEFCTPDVYNDEGGGADTANNFIFTGLSTDQSLNIVGQNGIDDSSGTLSLRSSSWMFFTGDIIIANDDASLTKFQFSDVDGDTSFGPTPGILQQRASSLQHSLINSHLVKQQLDLDGRVYDAGTANEAEVIPGAFRLADGSNTQPLQD